MDLGGVGSSTAFGDDVAEAFDPEVFKVAIFQGEAEASDASAIIDDLVGFQVVGDVFGVDKDVILVLVNVGHCVIEVVGYYTCEYDRTIFASLWDYHPFQ